MWLRTSCKFAFAIEVDTPFIWMLRPRSGPLQWVAREEFRVRPFVPVFEFTDSFGNLCQRLVAPPGRFEIHTSADVYTPDTIDQGFDAPMILVQHLPESVLHYLLPSRYCESDRFNNMAHEIARGEKPGYNQVAAITRWLQSAIRFQPGSSDIPVSAVEVNLRQSGVCRDLSHLGIALCRALTIPARLVVGYLHELKPMDNHAWFEAFVGGRWYKFDATQASVRGGYVATGYGRDAADVAIYNQFGPPVYPLEHLVSTEIIDGD
ncbi:MAG: cysteine protease [Spirochaetaceae bacterium]|nr:cysteine protease [Spirochaetaceae bacterium]|tara:strand:- start:12547 stop:13338 length:792 start_codon:yes stop_codon:yes gene_type:complete